MEMAGEMGQVQSEPPPPTTTKMILQGTTQTLTETFAKIQPPRLMPGINLGGASPSLSRVQI
jgi:hypothetical protein